MVEDDGQRRIVCVAGHDDDSLVVLNRVREWQGAWGFGVRAVFVTGPNGSAAPAPDAGWFRGWAERRASLTLDDSDVAVCDAAHCTVTLDEATDSLTGLIACATPTDVSSAIARISLRAIVARAFALHVPLLISRHYLYPRRILVVADGTPNSLRALSMGFEVAQHLGASMAHLNALCIRSAQLARMSKAPVMVTIKTSGAARVLRIERARAHEQSSCGFAQRVAKEAMRVQADVVVVGISRADQETADQILRIAPCSVLAVPCLP